VLGKRFIAAAIRWRNPLVGFYLAPIAVELIVLAVIALAVLA
jgi:hypothetical protein